MAETTPRLGSASPSRSSEGSSPFRPDFDGDEPFASSDPSAPQLAAAPAAFDAAVPSAVGGGGGGGVNGEGGTALPIVAVIDRLLAEDPHGVLGTASAVTLSPSPPVTTERAIPRTEHALDGAGVDGVGGAGGARGAAGAKSTFVRSSESLQELRAVAGHAAVAGSGVSLSFPEAVRRLRSIFDARRSAVDTCSHAYKELVRIERLLDDFIIADRSAAVARAFTVLDTLWELHDPSHLFLFPVSDAIAPFYSKTVPAARRMCLSDMYRKLRNGHYNVKGASPSAEAADGPLLRDLSAVIAAATAYNGEQSPLTEAAKLLKQAAQRILGGHAEQLSTGAIFTVPFAPPIEPVQPVPAPAAPAAAGNTAGLPSRVTKATRSETTATAAATTAPPERRVTRTAAAAETAAAEPPRRVTRGAAAAPTPAPAGQKTVKPAPKAAAGVAAAKAPVRVTRSAAAAPAAAPEKAAKKKPVKVAVPPKTKVAVETPRPPASSSGKRTAATGADKSEAAEGETVAAMKARLEQMEAVMRMLLAGQSAGGKTDATAALSGGGTGQKGKATRRPPAAAVAAPTLVESEGESDHGHVPTTGRRGSKASRKATGKKEPSPTAAGKKKRPQPPSPKTKTSAAATTAPASGRPKRAAALGARALAELEQEGLTDASESDASSDVASDSDDEPQVSRRGRSGKPAQVATAALSRGSKTSRPKTKKNAAVGETETDAAHITEVSGGGEVLDMPRRLEELSRVEEAVADLEKALTGAEGRAGAAGRPDFFAGDDEMARYIGEATVLQKMVAQVRQGKAVI